MILYLECRSYGIALDIPTTRDEAASTIFSLIAGFEDEPAEISISGVNSPIPNLYPYIQHADLDSGDRQRRIYSALFEPADPYGQYHCRGRQ